MKFKKLNKNEYLLCFNVGEEIITILNDFTVKEKIGFATFNGVGAYENVTIGSFNSKTNSFVKHNFKADDFTFEVLTFCGNITWENKQKPIIHSHTTFANKKTNVFGGHVFKAYVGVTFELHVTKVSDEKEIRKHNKRFNFKFWNL